MKTNIFVILSMFFVIFSAVPGISASDDCVIDVYGLYVSGNQITATIRNYDTEEQGVNYIFFVEDDEVNSGVIYLGAGENAEVKHSYNFGTGRHEVRIEVESSCDSDVEEIVYTRLDDWNCDDCDYCIEGSLRCDCADKAVYECRNDEWVLLAEGRNEYCAICGDEDCCGLPEPCWDCDVCGCDDCVCDHDDCNEYDCDCDKCGWDDYDFDGCGCHWDDGNCGVYIEEFNYIDNVKEDGMAEAEVTVRNTGEGREIITVRLFVDGIMKDSNSVSVDKNREFTRSFTFYPTIGTHEVKISAKANCGSSDWVSKIIKVVDLGDHIEPPPFPGPEPEPTSIEISPINLDIQRYDAATIVVNIHSKEPQYFRIDIRDYNFDKNWITYDREFYVDGDKSAYIYVTPDEYGEYEMDVYVTAKTEWKIVKETITFFVASPQEQEMEYDWFGGLVYFFTHPATVFLAIVFSLIIVIYSGSKLLIPEPESWES